MIICNALSRMWLLLIHFLPLVFFYTPWKNPIKFSFADVYRRYKHGRPQSNFKKIMVSFSPFSYSEKMRWGWGWRYRKKPATLDELIWLIFNHPDCRVVAPLRLRLLIIAVVGQSLKKIHRNTFSTVFWCSLGQLLVWN